MTLLQDMMISTTPAMVFGFTGLTGQIAWSFFRKRDTILMIQLGIAICYATQYALLGQKTGTCVCLIGATQTTIALIAGDRPFLHKLGYAFIPLVLILGLLTWSGAHCAFAMSACCLVMLGRMQNDTLRMRAIMLAAAPFGIGYDISTGAIPALIGAMLSAVTAAMNLRREWLVRHPHPQPEIA